MLAANNGGKKQKQIIWVKQKCRFQVYNHWCEKDIIVGGKQIPVLVFTTTQWRWHIHESLESHLFSSVMGGLGNMISQSKTLPLILWK